MANGEWEIPIRDSLFTARLKKRLRQALRFWPRGDQNHDHAAFSAAQPGYLIKQSRRLNWPCSETGLADRLLDYNRFHDAILATSHGLA